MKAVIFKILSFIPFALLLFIFRGREVTTVLSAACIHEAGHIIAAAFLGKSIDKINISAGGALITTGGKDLHFYQSMILLFSGIAANLFTYIICTLLRICDFLAFASLMLAVFNLIPIGTLDGGEAFYCLLEKIMLPEKAYAVRQTVSFVFIIILWAFAVFILFSESCNLSLFIVCVMLFTANFCNGFS